MTNTVQRGTFYPVIDRPPRIRLEDVSSLRARWTGKKRAPKAGEYYLSGAPVEAYRAPNDLTQVFHIAEIVRVTVTTQYHVTGLEHIA